MVYGNETLAASSSTIVLLVLLLERERGGGKKVPGISGPASQPAPGRRLSYTYHFPFRYPSVPREPLKLTLDRMVRPGSRAESAASPSPTTVRVRTPCSAEPSPLPVPTPIPGQARAAAAAPAGDERSRRQPQLEQGGGGGGRHQNQNQETEEEHAQAVYCAVGMGIGIGIGIGIGTGSASQNQAQAAEEWKANLRWVLAALAPRRSSRRLVLAHLRRPTSRINISACPFSSSASASCFVLSFHLSLSACIFFLSRYPLLSLSLPWQDFQV